jgi:hypothetical protein
MRQRLFVVLVALAAILSLEPVAAQPRRAAAAKTRESKAKEEKAKEEKAKQDKQKAEKEAEAPSSTEDGSGTPPAATAPEATPGDDLGAPPPKAAAPQKPETRPSPLTPAPPEFPSRTAQPPPFAYDKLLGDIAALRSRIAALTTTLFASKIRVVVETRGDNARMSAFNVTLDDGVVFTAPERFTASDERVVYEHAVAPGHHVLGVEIERYDARGREYRTWQSSRFSVMVPENKLVHAALIVIDDSGMAEDFPEDRDGEYDLRVRLRARVEQ